MAQDKALMKDVFGSSDEDDDSDSEEEVAAQQQERRPTTTQAASSPPPARRHDQAAAEQPLALTAAAQNKAGAGGSEDDDNEDEDGDGGANSPSSSSDASSQEDEEEPSASDASDKAKRHKSKHRKGGDKKRQGDKSSKKSQRERDKGSNDEDEGGGRAKGKAMEPAKHKLSKFADRSVGSDSEPEDDSRKALVARDRRDSDSEASSDDDRQLKSKKKIEYGPPLHLEAPLLDPPVGTDDQLHVIRCSNILGVETKPFDPDTFELEEDAYIDDKGQQRIKLRDANTIRWRVAKDEVTGIEVHESNARLVRWSDGSMQLLLGEEVLDVVFQNVATDNSFLFVRHEGLIQSQGQIASRINYRPSSLASKSHKMLAAAIDKRHAKTVRMKKTSAVKDPKLAEQELHAQEEQRIRAQVERLEKMQYKVSKKYQAPPIQTQKQALSARFLEEDVDDADADTRRMLTGDEEAEAEQRILRAKREAPLSTSRLPPQPSSKKSRPAYELTRRPTYESVKRAPARGREASESEDEDLSDDDDDDAPPSPVKETPVKQKRKVILSDDSD